MPTFTPRLTKEGMSSPSSPYNDIHYVGGLTTNHNSNKYNYNNVNLVRQVEQPIRFIKMVEAKVRVGSINPIMLLQVF